MADTEAIRRLHLRRWAGLVAAAGVASLVLPRTARTQTARDHGRRPLVAYFSRTGHTREAARVIAQAVDADLFEISPATPYPTGYQDTVDLNSRQIAAGEFPAAARRIIGLEHCDTVFLGYPIWAVDLPRVLVPFLQQHNFSGKRIAPFCTSAMSGLAGTEQALRRLCPGAQVLPGLSLPGGGRGHNTLVTHMDAEPKRRSEAWGRQHLGR